MPRRPINTSTGDPPPGPVNPHELVIVSYPDPVLKKPARHVPPTGEQTCAVAKRMIDLMFQAEGIGLAAPQVGLPWRMFLVHVPEDADAEGGPRLAGSCLPEATLGPRVYIDPRITAYGGSLGAFEEGCLSLPGIRGEVLRPSQVTVTATDLDGRKFTETVAGLLARCIQHELDHLDGVLIIDKMTQPSRLKNRKKIKDLEQS
ncbi:MAG: peptide deformylase [Phycisphaerales bacterium]|nr:peptide deformylase [Phycisphaerales bacterium]